MKVIVFQTDVEGAPSMEGIEGLIKELVGDDYEDVVVSDSGTVLYAGTSVETKWVG